MDEFDFDLEIIPLQPKTIRLPTGWRWRVDDKRPILVKDDNNEYLINTGFFDCVALTRQLDKFGIQYSFEGYSLTFKSDVDHAMFILYCSNDYNIIGVRE